MDNSISPISFNARIKIRNKCLRKSTYAKNIKRLQNIDRRFSDETANFSDEKFSLILTKARNNGEVPAMSMRISSIPPKSGNKFITDSFDTYLETMTDRQIAKKFAQIFKVLHYKNVIENRLPQIKTQYEKALNTINAIKPNATTQTEKQLIRELNKIINKLKIQYKNIKLAARENLTELTKGDEKLKEFVGAIL